MDYEFYIGEGLVRSGFVLQPILDLFLQNICFNRLILGAWIGTGHPPTAKSDVASAIGKTNQQLTNPTL